MVAITGNTFQSTTRRFAHGSATSEGREIIKTSFEEALRIDEVTSTLTYLGYANLGANDNDAVWKIKRIQQIGTVTTINYADGNKLFDNVWNNRASLNYL